MNRGSVIPMSMPRVLYLPFNEAPIHESGKYPGLYPSWFANRFLQ